MNQEKIGKFIAELRKEKNMTQQELADKLEATDRAISNWENGRRLPDYTFLPLLSDVLNTSIQELLNGRKMTKEEMLELKGTLENLIEYESNKEINNRKKINRYIIVGNILIALGIIHTQYNYLNYIFTSNFADLAQGLLYGAGMMLDIIGIYNNSHQISFCEKKKTLIKKIKNK